MTLVMEEEDDNNDGKGDGNTTRLTTTMRRQQAITKPLDGNQQWTREVVGVNDVGCSGGSGWQWWWTLMMMTIMMMTSAVVVDKGRWQLPQPQRTKTVVVAADKGTGLAVERWWQRQCQTKNTTNKSWKRDGTAQQNERGLMLANYGLMPPFF